MIIIVSIAGILGQDSPTTIITSIAKGLHANEQDVKQPYTIGEDGTFYWILKNIDEDTYYDNADYVADYLNDLYEKGKLRQYYLTELEPDAVHIL